MGICTDRTKYTSGCHRDFKFECIESLPVLYGTLYGTLASYALKYLSPALDKVLQEV